MRTPDDAFAVLSGTYDGHNVHTVGDAGDVNGDGIDDVVIGAPTGGPDGQGEAFIVFGPVRADVQLDTVAQPGGTPGIKINGRDASTVQRGAGTAITTAGDTNGDGFDDVMVSEPGTARPDLGTLMAGRVYIILGGPGSRTVELSEIAEGATADGYLLDGVPGDSLGRDNTLDAAGDANNDGYGDVIIGAPGSSSFGAYLVFGSPAAASIDLNEARASTDDRAVFMGLKEGATSAGTAVAGIGDVNGDGMDDVAIGAPGAESLDPDWSTTSEVTTGAVFIVYGRTDGATVDLGSLSADGLELNGSRLNKLGGDVAGLDDLNGDGVPEFAAVDRGYFVDWADEIGRVVIYDGASRSILSTFTGESEYPIDFVTEAGDTDGDGRDDLVVTRRPDVDGSLPRTHHVLLDPLAGGSLGADSAWQIELHTYHDDVAGVGDVSGNGVADVLAGDISASEGGAGAGAAYLFQGQERTPELPLEGPVSLTVTRVSSSSTDGDGTPVDMFVEATFGPSGELLDTEADRTVNEADAEPNWRLTSYQPYDASELSLSIALLDDDGALGDELLDLDAADGDHTLDLVIDRVSGEWGGDLVYPERCVTGPEAELCFDLDNLDRADLDTDGDGIADREELSGELAGLGADPCRKTIPVEIDHMVSAPASVTATDMVIEAFDVAPVPAVTDCPYPGFPRSTSGIDLIVSVDEELPDTADITSEQILALRDDAGHLAPFRRPWWHWSLYAGSLARERSGGFCCLGRWDFVSINLVANGDDFVEEGATLMHELGHALGLGHGGSDRVNHKPNYISIMNYSFSLSGLTRASDMGAVLDYSRWELPELHETDLSQPQVLGETGYLTTWSAGLYPDAVDASDTAEKIRWSYVEPPETAGITHDITFEHVCISGGPNGILDTEAAEGDVESYAFPRIYAGEDRDCDTAAQGDDRQVRSQGFEQADVLTTQNDWDNLHYRGALSGNTALGGFEPGHIDPDPESMSEFIEFWDRVRADPDNLEPEAVDDTYETPADTVLAVGAPGVLANDVDGDGDPLTASPLTPPSSGSLSLLPDGSFEYVPEPLFVGTDSFDYLVDDGAAGLAVATVTITVTSPSVNGTPVATDDVYTTVADAPLSVGPLGVLGNDADPDDDPLTARVLTIPSLGTVALSDDGSFVYTPDADASGVDAFTYEACDPHGACDDATVTVTVTAVNTAPTIIEVSPADQTVQHSDAIVPVTVTATDADGKALSLSTAGLPDGVVADDGSCQSLADGSSRCSWTLSGTAVGAAGGYTGTLTVSDGVASADDTVRFTVRAEDATATVDDDNPVAVQVVEPGGTSGPFSLSATVVETRPDTAAGTALPGDLSTGHVRIQLVPLGPGSTLDPLSCTVVDNGQADYDQQLSVTCDFDQVDVNTYTVEATVSGGFWTGAAEDVFTVSDPSLGFATGGGTFTWPDTAIPEIGYPGDRTNFGFTMKYNRKGTNLRGSLLVIRHLPDGTEHRIRSNALDGLALGEDPAVPMGWAAFSGKATYLQPGGDEPEGNHGFTVYVEDRNESDTGTDRFWLTTRDKDDATIEAFSLDEPADTHAQPLTGGTIVVPHGQGGSGKGGGP